MSKNEMNRRQKILDKALEMFNERGIEYVGLREMAGILDMRVSNITYYFPTKDDLVFELSRKLTILNSQTLVAADNPTIKDFLNKMRQAFCNHQKFRCLLLSVVHITKQNAQLAAEYKKTQSGRMDTLLNNLQGLSDVGYLLPMDMDDKVLLAAGISLVSRFWISEAEVSYTQLSEEAQMTRYLKLIVKLLLPYCTGKAAIDLEEYLKDFAG